MVQVQFSQVFCVVYHKNLLCEFGFAGQQACIRKDLIFKQEVTLQVYLYNFLKVISYCSVHKCMMRPVCVDCMKIVRLNQHALSCSSCSKVTHRCCSNGLNISQNQYFQIKRGQLAFKFTCKMCCIKNSVQYNGDVQIVTSAVSFVLPLYIFFIFYLLKHVRFKFVI